MNKVNSLDIWTYTSPFHYHTVLLEQVLEPEQVLEAARLVLDPQQEVWDRRLEAQ